MMAIHRRAARCLTYGALSLALAGTTRPCAAEEQSSAEAVVEARRAEAKSKYEAGVEAYQRGRYKDAADLFLAADRASPSATLSFNIARAYEKLNDSSSALRWYRDYLRRNPTAQNADAVREAITKLAAALAQKGVQQVSVFSTPAGATVSIDEQPVGVTPWTGDLSPGKHHVALSSRGYADAERDIELTTTEPLELSVQLEQAAPTASAPVTAPPAASTPAAASTPVRPASAPVESTGKSFGPWPWVTLGAGAVALGGSLTFELLRRSAESDAEKERTQLGFQSALDRMDSRKTVSRVLLGAGGALVLTGGVLLLINKGQHQSTTQVGFACFAEGCALRAGRRF